MRDEFTSAAPIEIQNSSNSAMLALWCITRRARHAWQRSKGRTGWRPRAGRSCRPEIGQASTQAAASAVD
jgi:hypothetical protein